MLPKLAVLAQLRALLHLPPADVESAKRRRDRLVNTLLLPGLLLASWLLRGKTVVLMLLLAAKMTAAASWFLALPPAFQVLSVALLPVLAWEIWFVDIKWVLHGSLWRSLHPDLVLQSADSDLRRVVGRIYRVETNPDGTATVWFALRGRGIMQRFHGLQRLRALTAPRALSARQAGYEAEAIEETKAGEWRLALDALPTLPVGDESAEAILSRPLRFNQLVTKEGLEGNPWHVSRVPQLVPGEVDGWNREEDP